MIGLSTHSLTVGRDSVLYNLQIVVFCFFF